MTLATIHACRLVAVTLLVGAVAACQPGGSTETPSPASSAQFPPPPTTTDRNQESPHCDLAPPPQIGVQEVDRLALSQRTIDITLESLAAKAPQHIAVTLPTSFDPAGATRYPVLYLLHGALDSYMGWFDNDLEAIVGDRPIIVVAVNSGPNNGYVNWYGTLAGTGDAPPAWQTHHIDELIPWVEQHFPVRTDRGSRAVAGLSMGGAGTMHYATKHPDRFVAAGSFSGAVNLTRDYPYYPVVDGGTGAFGLASGDAPGNCAHGDFILQHAIWKDRDPTYLVSNLTDIGVWVSCGGGEPDGLDYANNALDPIEIEVCEQTEHFIQALDAGGHAHTTSLYDFGTHTWDHWRRELGNFLTWMDSRWSTETATPERFDYRTIQPEFSVWGWRFRMSRDVREFVYLQDVSANGLTATGSGVLDIITPALYRPDQPYRLRVDDTQTLLRSDGDGRLVTRVDLGPSHTQQQLAFEPADRADWASRTLIIEAAEAGGP